MTHLRLLTLGALLSFAASATATSFVVTTDALVGAVAGTSDATSDVSTPNDDKIVLAARDDAASFIASAGAIRGVRLQAALQHIRQRAPHLTASDMQLAQAILSH